MWATVWKAFCSSRMKPLCAGLGQATWANVKTWNISDLYQHQAKTTGTGINPGHIFEGRGLVYLISQLSDSHLPGKWAFISCPLVNLQS